MSINSKVLLIDSESNIVKFLSTTLRANHYNVIVGTSGQAAISMTASHMPDIILLDIELPDMNGIELIKEIRAWSMVPIIVLTSRNYEKDKINALDAGADDYVTKPFSPGELMARIRVALRHKRASYDDGFKTTSNYSCRGLNIDFDKYRIELNGKEIHLTNIEFKIIDILCKYAGKVVTYDYLLKEIWGPYAREDNKTLRVNMVNLRRKLEKNTREPEFLFTEPGVGYRMAEAE